MRTIRFIFFTLVCQLVLTAKLKDTVAIHSKGSNIRLPCYRENPQDKLIWTTLKGTILFSEDDKYSKEKQYSNFEVEILEERSTLIIENADLDDEGEYFCSDSMGKEMVNVSIEVASNLEMKVNGIIEPSLMTNISVICRASGARPKVSIRIRVGEGGWLMPTVSETSPSGLLWDTIATFYILLPTDTTDTSVICQTFGQVSVEHITVTEYLSSPVCILQESTLEISCNCTSNPPVDKYLFAIGGETNVTGSTEGILSVANIMGSEVVCYGLSTLGIGKSNAIVVPPKEESESSSVFLIIAIVALIVLAVLVVSLVTTVSYNRWKKGRGNKNGRPLDVRTGKSGEDEKLLEEVQMRTSGGDKNGRPLDVRTGKSGEDEKLLEEVQTRTSGEDKNEQAMDNRTGNSEDGKVESSNGRDGNKRLNEAQTSTSVTMVSEVNSKVADVQSSNQERQESRETQYPAFDEAFESSKRVCGISIQILEGYSGFGGDKHEATKDFKNSGGVQQIIQQIETPEMTLVI